MELQNSGSDFEAAGIALFAILNDPIEQLTKFAEEYGITFPLLSDADSAVIRQYGILNTLIRPDESIYGIPYPGSYLTDEEGRVIEKFFNREYQVRETGATLVRSGFKLPIDLSQFPHDDAKAPDVRVSACVTAPQIKFMQHTDLIIRLQLAERLHVYGQPVPDGYFATEVSVTGPDGLRVGAARYPATQPFKIEGLHEDFNVFGADSEIVVPLIWASREGESLPIDIEVCYQACDEENCFLPVTRRLHIEVPIGRSVGGQRRE